MIRHKQDDLSAGYELFLVILMLLAAFPWYRLVLQFVRMFEGSFLYSFRLFDLYALLKKAKHLFFLVILDSPSDIGAAGNISTLTINCAQQWFMQGNSLFFCPIIGSSTHHTNIICLNTLSYKGFCSDSSNIIACKYQ